MRKVTSVPHSRPAKIRCRVPAERFCFISGTLPCLLKFRTSWTFQKASHPNRPPTHYSHTQQPLTGGFTHPNPLTGEFTHHYLMLSSQFYTGLHLSVCGSDYGPAASPSLSWPWKGLREVWGEYEVSNATRWATPQPLPHQAPHRT